jgi:hypothetical protein
MSIYKTWAPRCAMPDCNDSVGYHSSKLKNDGTRAYKWKTFCDHHRTVGKAARDLFLKSRGGCENRDGRAGFICKWPDSPSLTLDHWDGNKHNNDESNLVVLCANCHNEKSKRAGDTRMRYHNVSRMFYDLFQEES